MKQTHITSVSLSQDGKSPYWMAQWTLSTGLRQKKSTKVPVAGGLFQGGRLSRTQAKSRALLIAHELAGDALRTDLQTNKTSMLELCDLMLKGKLGRISIATYDNAKAAYKVFTDWLGKKSLRPYLPYHQSGHQNMGQRPPLTSTSCHLPERPFRHPRRLHVDCRR